MNVKIRVYAVTLVHCLSVKTLTEASHANVNWATKKDPVFVMVCNAFINNQRFLNSFI